MTDKTEKEKMLAGEYYNAMDSQLDAERTHARRLTHRLNVTEYGDPEAAAKILKALIPESGENIWIEPPFYCDYGYNIKLGSNVFFNFNCVVLDVTPVTIGSNVLFGPNVQIYTATHPVDAEERRQWLEFAKPITIGDDCWIGGGAIICPGVTIGDRCVIGAGAVVTKDIPDDSIAVGNPARLMANS
jgi:maltose O-acetyltransferase